MTTPLPFEPEKDESIRKRIAEALKRLLTLENLNEKDAAGLDRKHVFDTTEGFRVTVSRERHTNEDPIFIHVSTGVIPESAAAAFCNVGHLPIKAESFVREFLGIKDPPCYSISTIKAHHSFYPTLLLRPALKKAIR